MKLERYSEALENFQLVLELFKQIGSRAAEAETYKNLAELHQKLGLVERALEDCDRALRIAIELKIPLVKECEKLMEEINQQRE